MPHHAISLVHFLIFVIKITENKIVNKNTYVFPHEGNFDIDAGDGGGTI